MNDAATVHFSAHSNVAQCVSIYQFITRISTSLNQYLDVQKKININVNVGTFLVNSFKKKKSAP